MRPPASTSPVPGAARTGRRAQRGQMTVLAALFLVILAALLALCIDGGRAVGEALQVQKAADQAALSGVVAGATGGANSDALAMAQANAMVQRNLHPGPGTTFTVSTTLTQPLDTQLRVVVHLHHFPLLIAGVIGLPAIDITREATASYKAPAQLGNPSSTLGMPTSPITTYLPGGSTQAISQDMSLAINGPYQFTESGDPYEPLDVLSQPPAVSTAVPVIANPWRASEPGGVFGGYDYQVQVPGGGQGATYIQVYDAETCDGGGFGDTHVAASYGVPATSETLGYVPSHFTNEPTYYRVYKLDGNGNKMPVPSDDVAARGPSSTYASIDPNLVIAPTEGISPTTTDMPTCNTTFTNRWYTLLKVPADKQATYVINVTTCINPSANPSVQDGLAMCQGDELNAFALRAITIGSDSGLSGLSAAEAVSCGSTAPDNVEPDCQTLTPNDPNNQPSVSGMGRVSMLVQGSGVAYAYLAKLPTSYAGRWVAIRLFDPGDMIGSSSIQIVRPDGSYAPFEWSTETLDGSGSPITTTLSNNGSTSLITSYPTNGLQPPVPTDTPTPTWTPLPTATPNATATQQAIATATQQAVDTRTAVAGQTATVIAGQTATVVAGQTATVVAGQTATASAGQTATVIAGQTATVIAGQTATVIAAPGATQTAVAGQTATVVAGQTATAVAGQTATAAAGQTATAIAGKTATAIAGKTATAVAAPTATQQAIATATQQAIATATGQAGATATVIAGQTATVIAAPGATQTAIAGQTATVVAGQTATASAGKTATAVADKTATAIAGQTATASAGKTATAVAQWTPTPTPTPTSTPTPTPTNTPTPTPTATPTPFVLPTRAPQPTPPPVH